MSSRLVRPRRMRRQHWAAAQVASTLLLAGAGPAQAQSFVDGLNFETFNQSLWGSGAALGWNYDSGFLGRTWGGGASGASPVTWGFNGITGPRYGEILPGLPPQQITPEIPGYVIPGVPGYQIPAVHTPEVPAVYQTITAAVYTPAVPATFRDVPAVTATACVPFTNICTTKTITPGYRVELTPYIPPVLVTPEVRVQLTPYIPPVDIDPIDVPPIPPIVVPPVPAVYGPPIPPVYGDARIGASVAVSSWGAVGIQVKAGATAGAVHVALPVQASLNVPDRFVKGQQRHVSGHASLQDTARIDVQAPSFRGEVTGTINVTNELAITTCVFGAGCVDGSIRPSINQTVEIVSVNTGRADTIKVLGVPLQVGSGQDLPIVAGAQTVGHVTLTTPQDQSGGTVQGRSVSLESHQSVLQTTADLGGIAQFALDVPVDVLQPGITRGPATIGGTIFNVQEGVDLGMTQQLQFRLDVNVTLQFDQPVTMILNGERMTPSNQVTFNLEQGADLVFEGQVGRLLSRSYSVSPDSLFRNRTALSIDPVALFKAGCFNADIEALYSYEQCAVDEIVRTTDLVDVPVYDQQFALQGFQAVRFQSAAPLPLPVPEPASWALLLAGLGGLALRARRSRHQ